MPHKIYFSCAKIIILQFFFAKIDFISLGFLFCSHFEIYNNVLNQLHLLHWGMQALFLIFVLYCYFNFYVNHLKKISNIFCCHYYTFDTMLITDMVVLFHAYIPISALYRYGVYLLLLKLFFITCYIILNHGHK